MEFKITKLEQGLAVFNFEELKANLEKKLKQYTFVVVKDVELLKKQRAELNNFAKSIEAKRIETKKKILEAYDTVFEPQVKELVGLIKEVSTDIDARIKKVESEERQAKHEVVVGLWQGLKFDLVSLERIYQDNWLNKGTSERKIQDDMQNIIATITGNLALLDSTNTPDELKAKYLATLNIELTMAQYKAEQEAKARLNVEKVAPVEVVQTQEVLETVQLHAVNVQIISTQAKLSQLRKLLESNGYSVKQLTDVEEYVSEKE